MTNEKSHKLVLLERILRVMAGLVLKKYKPQVISITGSVGKTSAKEAVGAVLANSFSVRKSEKNYNNEIGIPLTIIGSSSGGRSIFGWGLVFIKWFRLMLFTCEYPEILVLEMGADRPGDIKYLTGFVKSKIAILTDISGSHLEYFKSLEGVAKEKGILVKTLGDEGTAIVNIDNLHIAKIKEQIRSKVITFGFSQEADVRSGDIFYDYVTSQEGGKEISGIGFKLNYKGTVLPMRLKNILAKHSIYAALAAVSVGIEMGLNLVEISAALCEFRLPPSRMNLLEGIKKTFIIDDSYNSSPASSLAALEALGNIEASRRIAVLGDMLELGKNSSKSHQEIVQRFFETRGDFLFLVGKRMKEAVQAVFGNNQEKMEKIIFCSDPMSTGRKLQEVMRPGDLVLVKGSQGMRMEKVVEEVMREPEKSSKLLCRQDSKWKEKPWKAV
jgi:UDP-N-acetylmuramoyl-tripeptide--D-alanyl-D-alanine ligase